MAKEIKELALQPGQGIVGHVIQIGRPVIVNDVSTNPYFWNVADQHENKRLNVTVSVGISTYDGIDAISINEIVREADEALYNSKKAGRNCATLFRENR
jgi:GGDEF domain-containing protein